MFTADDIVRSPRVRAAHRGRARLVLLLVLVASSLWFALLPASAQQPVDPSMPESSVMATSALHGHPDAMSWIMSDDFPDLWVWPELTRTLGWGDRCAMIVTLPCS